MPIPPSNQQIGVVYLITNLANGKVYVGQTSDLAARIRSHFSGRRVIGAAVRKYGKESFIVEQIGSATTQADLDNLESLWIVALRSFQREFGYNRRLGGNGSSVNAETRARMSQVHRDNPQKYWLGKKRPEQTALNRQKAANRPPKPIYRRKGAVPWGSPEHTQKLRSSKAAWVATEQGIDHQKKANAARVEKYKGIKLSHSDEAKKRRSDAFKKLYATPEMREILRQRAAMRWKNCTAEDKSNAMRAQANKRWHGNKGKVHDPSV